MSMPNRKEPSLNVTWKDAPTRSVDVGGTKFVYRRLGPDTGVPVIFLNHLAAELDRWDPRVVDGIAMGRRVIVFNNRGVGASGGSTPNSVAAMARDAIAFIRALGFEQVDLLGFSLGGFISQMIAQEQPQLVRKIILAGTGPAGGTGIDKVTSVTMRDMIRAALTFKHPEYYLFFTKSPNGRRAARAFLKRLKERTTALNCRVDSRIAARPPSIAPSGPLGSPPSRSTPSQRHIRAPLGGMFNPAPAVLGTFVCS